MRNLPRDVFLVVAATFFFFTSLDFHGTVYPLYLEGMGVGAGTIGFFVGLMTFAAILQRVPLARLANHRAKMVFFLGMICWAIAPIIYLFSSNLIVIGVARFLQGMGPAAVIVTTQILVAELAPRKSRGKAIALQGMADNAGILVGPALGYLVYQLFGFTGFWLSITAIAVTAMLIMLPIGKTREKKHVEVVHNASMPPSGSKTTLGSGSLKAVLTLGFILGLPFGVVFAFVPLHIISLQGNPSLYFVALSISSIMARVWAGRQIDQRGTVYVLLPGAVSLGLGFLTLFAARNLAISYFSALILGGSIGLTHTSLLTHLINNTTKQERSRVVAKQVTAADVGITFGSMGIGWLVELAGLPVVSLLLGIGVLAMGPFAVKVLKSRESLGTAQPKIGLDAL